MFWIKTGGLETIDDLSPQLVYGVLKAWHEDVVGRAKEANPSANDFLLQMPEAVPSSRGFHPRRQE